MQGFLGIKHKNHTDLFLYVISTDPVKRCQRFSWFSAEPSQQWTGANGINTELPHLKPRGHCFFGKTPIVKQLVKILGSNPYFDPIEIKENQIVITSFKTSFK